jgi:hypothetical protein
MIFYRLSCVLCVYGGVMIHEELLILHIYRRGASTSGIIINDCPIHIDKQ